MTGNGYIEIAILGRKVGLKFNMYAVEQFDTIKGRNGNIKNFTTIIWAGILGNNYAKQIEQPVTFEDVSDWVDEQVLNGDASGELNRITEVFKSSRVVRIMNDKSGNGEPAEDEKKMIIANI